MKRRQLLTLMPGLLAAPALVRAQGVFEFRDFGALAGGQDDSRALQSALDSGETIVNGRTDTFVLDRPLVVRNVPVQLRGGRLIFRNPSGGGLNVIFDRPDLCEIDDLEILAAADNDGDGLGISTTLASQAELDRFRHLRMVHLGGGIVIGGVEREQGSWRRALSLQNVNGADIGPLTLRGRPGGSPGPWRAGTEGLSIRGSGGGSPTAIDVGAAQIRNVETGVSAIGGMEGVTFDGTAIVNVRQGVVADWLQEGGRVNPRFVFDGGHVNASEVGLRLRGIAESLITNNLLYRFPEAAPVDGRPWIGIDLATADRVTVSTNVLNGWATRERTSTPGWPIRLTEVKRSLIADNLGFNIDGPIRIEGSRNRDLRIVDNLLEPFSTEGGRTGQVDAPDDPGVRLGWSF